MWSRRSTIAVPELWKNRPWEAQTGDSIVSYELYSGQQARRLEVFRE
jgi:hypothetical protein